MKPIASPLLRAITDREISLSPQSGDRLFDQGLCFAAVFIGGIGVLRARRGGGARRLVSRALGLACRLRQTEYTNTTIGRSRLIPGQE